MGRTIVGKYVPVLLAVSLFIAANFQPSPANMGYFALAMPQGVGPRWVPSLVWNLIPVGIGNRLVGGLLVTMSFWYALHPEERKSAAQSVTAAD